MSQEEKDIWTTASVKQLQIAHGEARRSVLFAETEGERTVLRKVAEAIEQEMEKRSPVAGGELGEEALKELQRIAKTKVARRTKLDEIFVNQHLDALVTYAMQGIALDRGVAKEGKTQWEALQESLGRKRERGQQAIGLVGGLTQMRAEAIADEVVKWMTQPYELTGSQVLVKGRDGAAMRLLDQRSEQTLLMVLPNEVDMIWQHLQLAQEAAWDMGAENARIVSLATIEDHLIEEAKDKGNLELWGREKLESICALYLEFEPEVSEITL